MKSLEVASFFSVDSNGANFSKWTHKVFLVGWKVAPEYVQVLILGELGKVNATLMTKWVLQS